jgi:photosystem II stability/assembly factor-like uncharacterized protein
VRERARSEGMKIVHTSARVLLAAATIFMSGLCPLAASADDGVLGELHWRSIGPGQSGGRVAAVAGTNADPYLYYIGAADGGVFRTDNGGVTWEDVWARQPVAAIGALAISPLDKRTVWVGTGESKPRNDASFGDGVWRTTDAGASWSHRGLDRSYIISRLLLDPKSPDIVIAGALGNPFLDSADRGVYRTTDGGATWRHTLYVGAQSGASDLACDKTCRLVFAGIWQFRRQPWTFTSGGPDDGIYRSTDGGIHWKKLVGHGLPQGLMGRIGLAVAPSDSRRVYALIESRAGVLWRSDDAGAHWRLMNRDDALNQRPFYMTRLEVDPRNADHVYFMSEDLFESKDGGKTFSQLKSALHQDHHALWLAADGKRMIEADDGGAPISVDGGDTWEWRYNIAIGQIYHLGYDTQNPYHICGGFQDNDSFCGPTDSLDPLGILTANWRDVGNDSDGIVTIPDVLDPDIVWNVGVKDLNGQLNTFLLNARQSYDVSPYARDTNGMALAGLPYRFNWEAPLAISSIDPKTVYFGGNVLFKTIDYGRTWQVVSPDLTRDERAYQQAAGGAVTLDVSGAEFYDTLLSIAPSPLDANVIWVGTDDGLVQVTRDGGTHWSPVAPPAPPYGRVENVEASPVASGSAFATVDRHFMGDRTPYIFTTDDFGVTWRSIATGLPADQYAHVVRQDPRNPDVLYLGLEQGIWISFDRGAHWQSLQGDLPVTAVRDLRVQPTADDLLVATHGRGFYVLDDLTALQALTQARASGDYLFAPRTTYAWYRGWFSMYGVGEGEGSAPSGQFVGENPPDGAIITYQLARSPAPKTQITFLTPDRRVMRRLDGAAHPGLNRVAWNLTEEAPVKWQSAKEWNQGPDDGASVPPGQYIVQLCVNGTSFEQPLTIKPDPRAPWTQEDYVARHDFLHALNDELSRIDTVLNALDYLAKRHPLDARGRSLYDQLTSSPLNAEDDQHRADRLRERVQILLDDPALSQGPPTQAQIAEAVAIKAQSDILMPDVQRYLGTRGVATLYVTTADACPRS